MTTSAPSEARALALSLVGSRVTALTLNWLEALESPRIDVTTELPCLPVAPKTVMVCFAIFADVEEVDELENFARNLETADSSFGMEM